MYQVREEEASGYNKLPKAWDYFTTKRKTFRITQEKNILQKSTTSQINQEAIKSCKYL